jgi:hypothetical protein
VKPNKGCQVVRCLTQPPELMVIHMDDKGILELFLRKVDELNNTRLVREGFDSGVTMKWSAETKALDFQFQQPDEELFRSLLLSLRHFLLKKEPTYIYKIYNICHRRLRNETYKSNLSKSRGFLDESLRSSGITLNLNNKHFSPDYVWGVFINGLYFHNDEQMIAVFAALSAHEINLAKDQLYALVNDSIRQINYVAKIVDQAFKSNELSF